MKKSINEVVGYKPGIDQSAEVIAMFKKHATPNSKKPNTLNEIVYLSSLRVCSEETYVTP